MERCGDLAVCSSRKVGFLNSASGANLSRELTVLVPSAYRPEQLARCLDALSLQTVPVGEILVVLRQDDVGGRSVCDSHDGVRCVHVNGAGLVHARQRGLRDVSTTWVAFVDDDAEVAPDWCEQTCGYLIDASVGCVGGPIVNFIGARSTGGWFDEGAPVATIGFAGRTVSHLHDQPSVKRIEDVDFLPGSNMTLRRDLAILADHGNVPDLAPNEELEWCLTVKDAGYRVVYDSDIRVAHYPAKRVGAPERDDKEAYAYAYAYMLTYALVRHLSVIRRIAFLAYFWLVGQRAAPGLLLAPFYTIRIGGAGKTIAGMRGRWRAMSDAGAS